MKKGFTLVELLAVIVILGILSILIVPKVINTLNDSEQKTNLASAEGLLNAAIYKATNDDIKGINENIIINYETGENVDKLDYSGKKPERGQVVITKEGKVAFNIKIGDLCYIKNAASSDIISKIYDNETCKVQGNFSEDSWSNIKANLMINKDSYEIGSEKEVGIDLDENKIIDSNERLKVRIVNTSSCPNTWQGSETSCGVVIEFKDIIAKHVFNGEDDNYTHVGGWPSTTTINTIYTYVNNKIYNALPNELKNIIIDTTTLSSHGYNDNNNQNFISNDKLYLLSTGEIGLQNDYDSVTIATEDDLTGIGKTRILEYYQNSSNDKRIKNYMGSATRYWLRSNVTRNNYFFFVSLDGTIDESAACSTNRGVAPAFRILD